MFTGIITDLGTVKNKTQSTLSIKADPQLITKLTTGASISVNGICLTVVTCDNDTFSIDFMPETSKKTTIHSLKIDDEVNLELPATPDTFLAGHIVQGHVDAVGEIVSIEDEGNSRIFTITVPNMLMKYIVEKGSITINGISLTVIDIHKNRFSVGIIPHTWEQTMLHTTKAGEYVNIEVDVLAKYLEKLTKSK